MILLLAEAALEGCARRFLRETLSTSGLKLGSDVHTTS